MVVKACGMFAATKDINIRRRWSLIRVVKWQGGVACLLWGEDDADCFTAGARC